MIHTTSTPNTLIKPTATLCTSTEGIKPPVYTTLRNQHIPQISNGADSVSYLAITTTTTTTTTTTNYYYYYYYYYYY